MTLGALRRCRQLLTAGAAAMLLGACATRAPDIADMPWTSGRLSVRIDAQGTQPVRSASSAFDLRGSSRSGELRLTSPLGTLVAQAQWAPGRARLITPEGEASFADLDQLSRQALGEALPLQAWPDWLAGRPWSGAPSEPLPDGFAQLGWRISLARLAEGWIDAVRDEPPAVIVRVRLDR